LKREVIRSSLKKKKVAFGFAQTPMQSKKEGGCRVRGKPRSLPEAWGREILSGGKTTFNHPSPTYRNEKRGESLGKTDRTRKNPFRKITIALDLLLWKTISPGREAVWRGGRPTSTGEDARSSYCTPFQEEKRWHSEKRRGGKGESKGHYTARAKGNFQNPKRGRAEKRRGSSVAGLLQKSFGKKNPVERRGGGESKERSGGPHARQCSQKKGRLQRQQERGGPKRSPAVKGKRSPFKVLVGIRRGGEWSRNRNHEKAVERGGGG